MEPIKPTFSEVVYSEMATWIGRTRFKSCNSTICFAVHGDFATATIRTMGRATVVCCDLDWPEHRHESLGDAGKSTHPGRLNLPPMKNGCTCDNFLGPHREGCEINGKSTHPNRFKENEPVGIIEDD